MKFAFYTTSFSPHQIPLAKAIMEIVGRNGYRYVSMSPMKAERRNIGWGDDIEAAWHIKEWENPKWARDVIERADILMIGVRNLPLIENRCRCGLTTIYCAERWFKPWYGILRLLVPAYFRMARRFARLLKDSESMLYLPIGIYAARDMVRLCGLLNGDLRCLFRAPELDFERKSGGRIWLRRGGDERRYCIDKMRIWGYFVAPSEGVKFQNQKQRETRHNIIKVLWVGRLLKLKRVDTIVRAVGEYAKQKHVDDSLPNITLDIYGTGPEENKLRKKASRYSDVIRFYPPVSIDEVRKLMQRHDVYILSSNAHEGWGAVVSEALEEGMKVIGTYEAGASATILPESCLFHAGDWRRLLNLLRCDLPWVGISDWNAKKAAYNLHNICNI